ncbi:transcriptional regulator XRE family [Candidatus Termititenax persephonae]|uniref:Transcriptional regulator XRE family n=1 Tax=Candidatus Termititenax persephonae TaxID=2218525 RepID=A0A388TK46_9BACT|nr:transcriptional regulator XRE family [Candidatus Termititenax persephonae]
MLKFKKWDIVDHLQTEKDIKEFLEVVFEEGDPDLIPLALGAAARARRLMPKAAKKAGVGRESLYRSLSKKGNPYFKTVHSVINSLGYKLKLVPA